MSYDRRANVRGTVQVAVEEAAEKIVVATGVYQRGRIDKTVGLANDIETAMRDAAFKVLQKYRIELNR